MSEENATEVTEPSRSARKVREGNVVSDKMDKTVVVSVERLRRHPIYKRVVRLSSKFKAHDQENSARVGDTVRIEMLDRAGVSVFGAIEQRIAALKLLPSAAPPP